jgi:hemoglobin
MKTVSVRRFVAFAVSVGIIGTFLGAGCSSSPSSGGEAARKAPLYDRLGGEAAIKLVVDDFVGRAATDSKVNFTRVGTGKEWKPTEKDLDHLKMMLVQFIGMATGGPQKYEGRAMPEVHRGMKITGAEFDALAGDLAASLDKFKVSKEEKDELLKVVASTRKDIVEQ